MSERFRFWRSRALTFTAVRAWWPGWPAMPGLVILLLLLGGAGFGRLATAARAAEVPPGPDVRELWVPEKNLAEALKSSPRAVILTAEQMETLLRDARPPRRSGPEASHEAASPPPVAAVLTDVVYEGTPGAQFVSFHATFTVECLTGEWTRVPLSLRERWIGGVKLDGESALRAPDPDKTAFGLALMVRGKGRHSLIVDFAVPLDDAAGFRSFTLVSPGSAGARLRLAVPEELKLQTAVPYTREGGEVVFALPPDPEEVIIRWSARDLAPLEGGAFFQKCQLGYSLDPARVMADLALGWHSPLRPLPSQLVLPLPPEVRVLSAAGPDLLRWTLAGDRLVAEFPPDVRHEASLRLLLERDLNFPDNHEPLKTALPAPVAEGVSRTWGEFSLSVSRDLRVRDVHAGSFAERDDSRFPEAVPADRVFFGTWVFSMLPQPPEVELQPLRVQFAATLDTQISLSREAVRLKRWLTVTPRDGTLFSPRLESLAQGEEIEAVKKPDDQEVIWKRAGDGLVFPDTAGLAAGKPWTVVVESRLDPAGWQAMGEQALPLALASARVPEAGKLNGYVAVDFDDSLLVTSQPVSGLEPRDPSQFAGTLPLTGRLAWSRLEDFQLRLEVSRRRPEYDASVVLYALPLLNSLEVEGGLNLSVGGSPLREVRVVFPTADAAGSVRWDSPLLAESVLEPDNSWRLRFHQETSGRMTLRFRLSMPLTDKTETAGTQVPAAGAGQSPGAAGAAVPAQVPVPERRFTVAAPVLSVPGARRLSGSLVVEANTDTELTFSAKELDPLDILRAPELAGYVPAHRLVSAWTWQDGQPLLTIEGVRHRPGPLVSTVIDQLALDTVVSADGPVRHQARIVARTAGDQYLEMVLPPDSRVMTLLVNEAVTKPVRSPRGGLRVPLSGEVSVIRLICECPGSGLSSAALTRLEPVRPDAALPVLDTQWRLHLPDGFSYSGFDSNLAAAPEGRPEPQPPAVLALMAREFSPTYGKMMSAGGNRHGRIRTVGQVQQESRRSLESLEHRLAAQKAETDAAREEVLRQMKLYGIIDTSLMGSGGGPSPFVGTGNMLYMQSKEKELEMQSKLAAYKANLEGLSQLSGDQLIEGAMAYGVEDDTIKQFTSQWKSDRVEKEKLIASGLGEAHPQVRGLTASIEREEKILREAAENYQESLRLTIQNMESALSSMQDVTKEKKAEKLDEKMASAEYNIARQKWEEKMELLNRLRETVLKTTITDGMLSNRSPDDPYLSTKLEVLPGAVSKANDDEGDNRLNYNSAPEPQSVEEQKLGTRAFRVPADFLARGIIPGTETAGKADGDPFASGTDAGGAAIASKPTALNVLSSAGIYFPEGATATFAAGSATVIVRNTPGQLAVIQRMLDYDGTVTSGRGGSAGAGDRVGILPLEFSLPEGGKVYRFTGQYPPGVLSFRSQSWESQTRWTWVWVLLGGAAFRLCGGWRSPWCVGITGAAVLQMGPVAFGYPDWLSVANALVIGWCLTWLWRLISRRVRRRAERIRLRRLPAGLPATALVVSGWLGGMAGLAENGQAQEQPSGTPVPDASLVQIPAPDPASGSKDGWPGGVPSVLVPFDPDKPLEEQSAGRRYLDYAVFQKLWEAAKTNRRAAGNDAAATGSGSGGGGERGAVLTSALHRAETAGTVLKVESVLTLLTHGADWVAVPLTLENGLRSLSLDGAPAALKDGQLLVEKAGTHTVTAVYEVPLPAGWREVEWRVPRAAAASLALSLAMDDPARPVVNGGSPLVESEAAGRRVFTAPLGAVDRVSVRRQTMARRGGDGGGAAAQPSLARVVSRVFVSRVLERAESEVSFGFAGQERADFRLWLEAGLTPVSFEVPDLESWNLRPGTAEDGPGMERMRILDFSLARPVRESFAVKVVAERPVNALPATETAPVISAAAGRVEREWSVLAAAGLEVHALAEETGGPRRVNFSADKDGDDHARSAGFETVGTWRAEGGVPSLRWELRNRVLESSAVVRYALQPGAGKLELSAGIELHPSPDDPAPRDIVIQLPEEATVQGVASDLLTDWWHEGRSLHVRLMEAGETAASGGGGGSGEVVRLALNLTRPLPAGKADFTFTPLAIDGFSKVSGSALLIAPVNQETTMALSPAAPGLRETAPAEAATGFAIRPPFEARRAFVFENADWTATATLQPLAARYDVDWVLDAEVRDSWVELNTRVMLALTRGGLDRLEFTTPAAAPEYQVTGDGLRETVSVVEGAVRRYTVSFQSLRSGTVFFTLTGQIRLGVAPAVGGDLLPDLDFPGAARVSRFVIVGNQSSGNLKTAPSGLEVSPKDQLSLLPADLVSGQTAAQFYRARPGWSMRVMVEKLETSAGQAAVVTLADLTTSLLRNGDVWHRAVYTLQNRSLQFLPVSLPAGAEVVSVMVGGETTRADSGMVSGLPVLLVPLIQTSPGERATEVKLIYRLRGQPGVFPETLDDPKLPGLPISRTLWTVQYPDNIQLDVESVSMSRVGDFGLNEEKVATRQAELNSLQTIALSGSYDEATRQRARYNAERIADDLHVRLPEDNSPAQKERPSSPLPAPPPANPTTEGLQTGKPREFVLNGEARRLAETAKSQSEAQPQADGQQVKLSLNDSVSWEYRPAPQPAGQQQQVAPLRRRAVMPEGAASKDAPADRPMEEMRELVKQIPPGGLSDFASSKTLGKSGRESQMISQEEFTDLNRNYSFGNARLNNGQEKSAGANAADARGGSQTMPSASTAATKKDSPSASLQVSGLSAGRKGAGQVADFTGTSDGEYNVGSPQQRLRTSGRISLEAAFPSQHQEVHFRKTQGNASLRLRVAPEPEYKPHWGMRAGLVGLIISVFGLRWLFRIPAEKLPKSPTERLAENR